MDEIPCSACPLRPLPLFIEQNGDELALVQSLKRREVHLNAGETLIHEGQTCSGKRRGVELTTDLLESSDVAEVMAADDGR